MSEALRPCSICKTEYPEDCLDEMVTTAGRMPNVCGICALQVSNELHGMNRTKFNGPMAEEFRQRALAHRRKVTSRPLWASTNETLIALGTPEARRELRLRGLK